MFHRFIIAILGSQEGPPGPLAGPIWAWPRGHLNVRERGLAHMGPPRRAQGPGPRALGWLGQGLGQPQELLGYL